MTASPMILALRPVEPIAEITREDVEADLAYGRDE